MKQIIKTTEPVGVETRNGRDVEHKIVYAKLKPLVVDIYKKIYTILIDEYVIENIESTDVEGNPIVIKQERNVAQIKRERTDKQVMELISILQNETELTAYGLTHLIGVYDTLNQVERNKFVAETAHLIENNRDLIRGTSWEVHTEPVI